MAEESVELPVTSEVTMSCGLRRHSAGKASSGNTKEKVVPNYLRASTGSCHDLCKYGRKHALEAKVTRSIPKRAERIPLHQSSEESISGNGIMKSVSKVRASVMDSKPTKKRIKPADSDSQKQIGNEVVVNRNKSSFLSKSHISSIPTTRRPEISSNFKAKSPSKPTSKKVETSSVSTSKKEGPPLKSTSKRVKTRPKPTSLMVKTSSKSTSKKTQTSSKLSSFKDNNEVEEKTLYVITMESENQTLPSDQNASQDIKSSLSHLSSSPKVSSSSISESSFQKDQEESEYATSEFEEDSSSGNYDTDNRETLEVEENGKPQKDGIVCCEDPYCQMLRGKVVETQIEKSGLKMIKFRKGNVKGGGDNICAITGSEKVVLRHRDVHGKKDGQGLFNNVIEETASKLVETQKKSKVKALVGAFETVISLQDKKHFVS